MFLDEFEGFDTKVLESKTVFNMTATYGRKRQHSVLVVTGNKQGLGGFALGKALEPKTAIRKAKNRAGQKMLNVHLFRNHTSTELHNYFLQNHVEYIVFQFVMTSIVPLVPQKSMPFNVLQVMV